jgi:hypothetical protein
MRRIVAATASLLCLAFVSTSVAGRTEAEQRPQPLRIPRTQDGRPDFQGVWSLATFTPLERPQEFADRPFVADAEAADFVRRRLAAVNNDHRPADFNEFWNERPTALARWHGKNLMSLIVDPADGHFPPLTPAAQARVDAVRQARRDQPADGPEDQGRSTRCLSAVPLSYIVGFVQVVQTSAQLVFVFDAHERQERRILHLTVRPHLAPALRSSLGDSRARWDGDTLVVDTTNYDGRFDFEFRGADADLHIMERFQLVDADTLLEEATIDDPSAFTTSWTVVVPMRRTSGRLFESACHEGNYALRNILSGARAEEAELSRRSK